MRPGVTSAPSAYQGVSEFHLRRGLRIIICGELCHGFVGAEKCCGPQYAGEGFERGIVDPHRLDIVAPRNSNPIFGAFELRLERKEVLI